MIKSADYVVDVSTAGAELVNPEHHPEYNAREKPRWVAGLRGNKQVVIGRFFVERSVKPVVNNGNGEVDKVDRHRERTDLPGQTVDRVVEGSKKAIPIRIRGGDGRLRRDPDPKDIINEPTVEEKTSREVVKEGLLVEGKVKCCPRRSRWRAHGSTSTLVPDSVTESKNIVFHNKPKGFH